ncbi:MAG: MarR family winged helix-turn-helix transcriptional regulator [Bilifractor sp.]
MKQSLREITKIAREVSKFTVRTMKAEGVGTAEFDFIHAVRHHPGITQVELRGLLGLDKGACARRAASLEAKGYLIREKNPEDRRSSFLYATPKAEELKISKVIVEKRYYEWLFSSLSAEEYEVFMPLLHKIYLQNKKESLSGFVHVARYLQDTEQVQEQDIGQTRSDDPISEKKEGGAPE